MTFNFAIPFSDSTSKLKAVMCGRANGARQKIVGVVGAGAAGLVTAKILREAGHIVKVYEASSVLGGTWQVDTPHSALYKSLHTNLPTHAMQYRDFPFDPSVPSFPSHSEVLKYLQRYARTYNLHDVISFNTKVTNAVPRGSTTDGGFKLTTLNTKTQLTQDVNVEHLVVCSGHYTKPFIPVIPGIENFTGKVLHSHSYREPSSFANKNVLVIGNAASGADISRELRTVAAHVIVATNTSGEENVSSTTLDIRSRVASITPEGHVLFEDSSCWNKALDVILYCTGYLYDFDFLEGLKSPVLPESVKGAGAMVAPLYKHVFHITHPALSFIGLPFKCIPFLVCEIQARWVAQVAAEKVCLPSSSEMQEDFEVQLREEHSIDKFHCIGDSQFDYCNDILSRIGQDDRVHPIITEMYFDASTLRHTNPENYRSAIYNADFTESTWSRKFSEEG